VELRRWRHRPRVAGTVGRSCAVVESGPRRSREADVAAIASCHFLTFLYLAAKRGFAVASYRDDAVGVMAKNERGRAWVSKVTLSPRITWSERAPAADELAALHHAAHDECFIASSVRTEIVVATSEEPGTRARR
jgi:organic hydroperoxide reductase OsmC/OhrA